MSLQFSQITKHYRYPIEPDCNPEHQNDQNSLQISPPLFATTVKNEESEEKVEKKKEKGIKKDNKKDGKEEKAGQNKREGELKRSKSDEKLKREEGDEKIEKNIDRKIELKDGKDNEMKKDEENKKMEKNTRNAKTEDIKEDETVARDENETKNLATERVRRNEKNELVRMKEGEKLLKRDKNVRENINGDKIDEKIIESLTPEMANELKIRGVIFYQDIGDLFLSLNLTNVFCTSIFSTFFAFRNL